MNKVTYEEATKWVNEIIQNDDWSQVEIKWEAIDEIADLLEQHSPPAFDEVVKAWEDTIDDKLEFKNNDEGIRVIYPNGIYYLINREQVYSNRKVFSMNVNATLNAINLTVEYLKNRQINEPAKATK